MIFSLINWFQKATFLKTNVVWIAVAYFFPQIETTKTLSLEKKTTNTQSKQKEEIINNRNKSIQLRTEKQ